ncbi:DUF371 domain-containing protein [Halovenus rubra]|uniref:DUF371 domain-containing protein n=2 Tax=Halovenus rubra TaxID=869890 RepID=A0ABD5X709_9EURY|nr:DUF371 domain-containing protein [Halovenus rubra]
MSNDSATLTETVTAHGHENISAEHESTFEVTSDDFLTPAGDCIVGIEAGRVPESFDEAFVEACQHSDSTITVTLETVEHRDRIEASGSPDLTFESNRSMVIRTSEYVDDRTIAVKADKAASDLNRSLVGALADGESLTLTLTVKESR